MAIIAPWIQAPDVAGLFARGFGIGAQIAQEHQRLAAENARTTMEAQARQETNLRQMELEKARIATEQAYRQTHLDLERDRLNQTGQALGARLRQAALIARDQAMFNQDISTGMDIATAMARHPLARAQQAIEQQGRAATEQREAGHQKVMEQQGQANIDLRKQAAARLAVPKPVRIGSTSTVDLDNPLNRTTTYQYSTPVTGNGRMPAPENFPDAPADPSKRQTGMAYKTPKGPHIWTGKGWQKYEPAGTEAAGAPDEDAGNNDQPTE